MEEFVLFTTLNEISDLTGWGGCGTASSLLSTVTTVSNEVKVGALVVIRDESIMLLFNVALFCCLSSSSSEGWALSCIYSACAILPGVDTHTLLLVYLLDWSLYLGWRQTSLKVQLNFIWE
jgi:hypothetical protein